MLQLMRQIKMLNMSKFSLLFEVRERNLDHFRKTIYCTMTSIVSSKWPLISRSACVNEYFLMNSFLAMSLVQDYKLCTIVNSDRREEFIALQKLLKTSHVGPDMPSQGLDYCN